MLHHQKLHFSLPLECSFLFDKASCEHFWKIIRKHSSNNTKLSLYTEYVGNTVNECEEYVWREMEKFRAAYGDPVGERAELTKRFLNMEQKIEAAKRLLQEKDRYQEKIDDEE